MSALFNENSTRADLNAALKKAEDKAEIAVAIRMGPISYEWCQQQQDMYNENLDLNCRQAVREAQAPIWAEWYKTPQGAEEKRLAEEAERLRMEEKQALAEARLAKREAKRLAYAKSQGFDTVIAYIDYVNSTWRYCHKNPWVSWLTCIRRVQVPEWW